MISVELTSETNLSIWRKAARALIQKGISPNDVVWTSLGAQAGLLAGCTPQLDLSEHNVTGTNYASEKPGKNVYASRRFIDTAERVLCHRDCERFAKLYQLLWRLQDNKRLLENAADPDVAWLTKCDQAVRRDRHKMHAFVRFRKVGERDGREQFAAWFEPEHRIVELATPFFKRRFPNMDWAILTPDRSAIWNGETLKFSNGANKSDVPSEDAVEEHWKIYFAAIFNPARLKVSAMTSEMPKKYWRNLPEAELIPELIASARARTTVMQTSGVTQQNKMANIIAQRKSNFEKPFTTKTGETLGELNVQISKCERCSLHCHATQAVTGTGPQDANLMIVGEQPGDQEDLAGKPFVGPAGNVLNQTLKEAGIDRAASYITNAVKHFKFTPRGKRRIHAKPSTSEIDKCRWWLDIEQTIVRPKLIVALGATAARSVLGQHVKISETRGKIIEREGNAAVLVTAHPSYLLRLPDPIERMQQTEAFAQDLIHAKNWLDHSLANAA